MKFPFEGKVVAVTGGAGFVGSHLVDRLLAAGATVRILGRRDHPERYSHSPVDFRKVDLRSGAHAREALRGVDEAFHLASSVGGVAYNQARPASLFSYNMQVHLGLMEAARLENVGHLTLVSSTCVYSREADVPTVEDQGFFDHPEPANRGYGWSKRGLELLGRFYHDEYGMRCGIVRPANVYGPRDNFDEAHGHVIPSLILRAFKAETSLVIWGSGSQTRSFVYVDDVVRGLMLAAERLRVPDPINLGSDEEVTILDLARFIVEATGRPLQLETDPSKPVGQVRKAASTAKAARLIGFRAEVGLRDGLERTVRWFRENRARLVPMPSSGGSPL